MTSAKSLHYVDAVRLCPYELCHETGLLDTWVTPCEEGAIDVLFLSYIFVQVGVLMKQFDGNCSLGDAVLGEDDSPKATSPDVAVYTI